MIVITYPTGLTDPNHQTSETCNVYLLSALVGGEHFHLTDDEIYMAAGKASDQYIKDESDITDLKQVCFNLGKSEVSQNTMGGGDRQDHGSLTCQLTSTVPLWADSNGASPS